MNDKELQPLSEFVLGLVDWRDDEETAAILEEARLELPIELAVRIDDDGEVRVEASPPRQQIETTVLPVFHTLKLRVTLDGNE
jgi:hypothetical protein